MPVAANQFCICNRVAAGFRRDRSVRDNEIFFRRSKVRAIFRPRRLQDLRGVSAAVSPLLPPPGVSSSPLRERQRSLIEKPMPSTLAPVVALKGVAE